MANTPSSSENLSDRVTQHLITHIRTNQLQSGAALPSEVRVSADLGVSRGIVREAFRALKMAGILEISNGRSPRVGRLSDEGIVQFFDHALTTNQTTIAQVLDLRATVEVRAAELAATNREAKHIISLQKDVSIMQGAKHERERFIDADADFHQTIGQATGNPLFELIGGALRGSLAATIRAGLENRTRRREVDQIVVTHKRIADAITERDPVQAREYMIIHFQEAFRSFSLAHKL